jgi:hypothetical protein
MPVTIKTGVGGGSVTLDSGSGVLDTTLTLPNINGTVLYSDANGNVGIGTSSPSNALSVDRSSGEAVVSITNSGTASSWLTLAPGSSGSAYIHNTSNTSTVFTTNGTERMRIDSSGSVGIGTSSPGSKLEVNGNISSNTAAYVYSYAGGSSNQVLSGFQLDGTSQQLLFFTGTNERARLDANGNFLVGTTSLNYANSGFTLSKDSGTTKWLVGPFASAPTNFYVTAASSLGVYLAGTSATSWSSASDERLKDIIEPIEGGLQKVNALRAVIGSYKADEAKTRRAFLIAQDLQNVLPEAVDASNPDALGVQYTEVIPLLVAAIQELSAKNDALEARLAALEAK